jgi:hypothetical protein
MDIRVRWADNTRELAANLKSGADQIEVTKAAAEKMAQSLQGDKLIQAAANMAAAIQQVGGTTTLTASQMERANALFEKAAEKLQLTGQGGTYAAQTFRELAEQTKGASEETTNWLTIMRDVGTSWVARIAEGVLLRDAIRDVIGKVKELAAALPEIALKGAAVADVEENFNRLTAQAGRLGSTLMGALKDGTHNTIDNFQLMKTATQDLAAGMNLTDQQFSTLAKGAFALAQATGTDVKTALDTMNDAMLTGRTRALALLTGKIDLSAAEEAYAKKLGTTVDHLTDAGKLEAARVGILDSVTAATKRLGDQTDGLDERVAQAGAAWENFKDDLGKTIATSDVLATGLTELKRSLEQTFGGSQDALIAAIAAEIDDVAIASVKAAELVVEAGGLIVKEWSAAKVVFGDVAQVIDGVRLAYLMTRQAMTLGLLPGHVDLREWQQLDKQIGDLELSMVKRGQALQADKAAEESADAATAKYVATLDQLRQHMEEARQRSLALAQQATATATATNTASAAAENHAALLKRSASEIAKDKTAYEEWQKAVKNLTDQFDGMDWDYTIDGALKLGGSVNDISKYFGLSEGEVNRHKEALKVWAAVAKLEAAGAARGLSSELEHLGTVIPGSQFAASAKIFGNITEMNAKPAQIPPGLENLGQKIKPAMDDVAKTVTTTFDNSFRKLPDLLIASFTGNGNFWGGLKALGTDITKGLFGGVAGSKDAGPFAGFTKGLADAVTSATSFLGKSISGILGSTISGFLPGIGSLIGPAISGVISFIKNIGGPSKEELSARDQQNELVKQLTSNLTDAQQAQVAELAAAHGGERTYATLAIAGRDAMLKIGMSAADADKVVQGLLDTHNPQRFAAAMKQVQDALTLQTNAQNALNDALSRYHFTTEQLGPALRAQKLDEQAQQLYQDWQVLNSAGIDTVAISQQMSASVNDYLQTALKTGTEIPIAMKPMLEQMAKMGDLTDAAGNKLTEADVDGMNFSTTMTQGFKDIVKSVKDLTDVIARGLGVAIDDVTKKINGIPRDITVNVGVNRTDTGGSGEAPPETPGYARGVRGFAGGWAVVGEDGPELLRLPAGSDVIPHGVIPSDFGLSSPMSAMSGTDWQGLTGGTVLNDAGQPIVLDVTVQSLLDGQVVAENTVRRVVQNKRGVGTVLKRGLPA